MAKTDVCARVEALLEGYLAEHALALYRVEYRKEGKDWILRVFPDKPEGSGEYVSIEECEDLARYLSDRLDEEDFIDRSYTLEVSSPGLDRELIKADDYKRFSGRAVSVSLYEPYDGQRELEGVLIERDEASEVLRLSVEAGEIAIPLKQLSKVKLAIVF